MAGILGDVVASASANRGATCAATVGILFVAWCFYFDRRRRADPNFRKKLRERRMNARKCPKKESICLPDMRDNEAVMKFFLQEIKKGEELLGKGDESGAVEHMAYAVATCGHPTKLLEVLNLTLPVHIFRRLLDRLPSLSEEITENPTGALIRQS